MNREIKFRIWDIPNQEWLKYKYLEGTWKYEHEESGASSSLQHCLDNPIDFIVVQFTGLKDKNLVEIYEGDIIDNGSLPRVVVFHDGNYWAQTKVDEYLITKNIGLWQYIVNFKAVKIGTIHEDPELLKIKKNV